MSTKNHYLSMSYGGGKLSRIAGKVVSFAPLVGRAGGLTSATASIAAFGAMLVVAAPEGANAQTRNVLDITTVTGLNCFPYAGTPSERCDPLPATPATHHCGELLSTGSSIPFRNSGRWRCEGVADSTISFNTSHVRQIGSSLRGSLIVRLAGNFETHVASGNAFTLNTRGGIHFFGAERSSRTITADAGNGISATTDGSSIYIHSGRTITASGIGIRAESTGGLSLSRGAQVRVIVRDVESTGDAGIMAIGGPGTSLIEATSRGAVKASGIGILAEATGERLGGNTSFRVFAHDVESMNDVGIVVRGANDNSYIRVTVTGTVTGADGGIETHDSHESGGGWIRIDLRRGADIDQAGKNAIHDKGNGNAAINVMTGATVKGSILLGAGDDSLVISDADFSGLEGIDGGDDADAVAFGRLASATLPSGFAINNVESVVVAGSLTLTGGFIGDEVGAVTLERTGRITGDITANDAVTLNVRGEIMGDVNLGPEADRVNISGGRVIGDIATGAGDDVMTIMRGGAIASAENINLGAGADRLTISKGFGGPGTGIFVGNLDGGEEGGVPDDNSVEDTLVFDNDTHYVRPDPIVVNGPVTNWEDITVTRGSHVRLEIGELMVDGTTLVISDGGRVVAAHSGGLTLTGAVELTGGTFLAETLTTVHGDVRLNSGGTISLRNEEAGDVLTVMGDVTLNGGIIELDAVLGAQTGQGNASPIMADSLSVTGMVIGRDEQGELIQPYSPMVVSIRDENGVLVEGQLAVDDRGDLVMQVDGVEDPVEIIAVAGDILLPDGVELADLFELDSGGVEQLHEAYPALFGELSFSLLPSIESRAIFRQAASAGAQQFAASPNVPVASPDISDSPGREAWAIISAGRSNLLAQSSATGRLASVESDRFSLSGGSDFLVSQDGGDSSFAGVNFHYATLSSDAGSGASAASVEANAYGAGASWTWVRENGFYVDAQALLSFVDSDFRTRGATSSGDSTSVAAFLSAGRRIDLGEGNAFTPQAQIRYGSARSDDFGGLFSISDGDIIDLRLGGRWDRQGERGSWYGYANLLYRIDSDVGVRIGTRNFTHSASDWGGEVGFGGSYALSEGMQLFGEASLGGDFEDIGESIDVNGRVGIRFQF